MLLALLDSLLRDLYLILSTYRDKGYLLGLEVFFPLSQLLLKFGIDSCDFFLLLVKDFALSRHGLNVSCYFIKAYPTEDDVSNIGDLGYSLNLVYLLYC
jgi:hypothetical protein